MGKRHCIIDKAKLFKTGDQLSIDPKSVLLLSYRQNGLKHEFLAEFTSPPGEDSESGRNRRSPIGFSNRLSECVAVLLGLLVL
jgi:hypothetical protein